MPYITSFIHIFLFFLPSFTFTLFLKRVHGNKIASHTSLYHVKIFVCGKFRINSYHYNFEICFYVQSIKLKQIVGQK